MNILHRIWSRAEAADPAPTPLAHPPEGDAIDLARSGCGWFDSSHELQAGLVVSEHDGDGVAAAALPLETWLDLQLADWQPRLDAIRH